MFEVGVRHNDRFVFIRCPTLQCFFTGWDLKGDVVNAVIFASAASWPELAISVITVFDTRQPGVGIGTIVGTSVFNTLAVPAICSFLYHKVFSYIGFYLKICLLL